MLLHHSFTDSPFNSAATLQLIVELQVLAEACGIRLNIDLTPSEETIAAPLDTLLNDVFAKGLHRTERIQRYGLLALRTGDNPALVFAAAIGRDAWNYATIDLLHLADRIAAEVLHHDRKIEVGAIDDVEEFLERVKSLPWETESPDDLFSETNEHEQIRLLRKNGDLFATIARLDRPDIKTADFIQPAWTLEIPLGAALAPAVHKPNWRILVAYMDEGVADAALGLVTVLREIVAAETWILPNAKNIGKQIAWAEDSKVDYVVVIGGREWAANKVTVKDFQNRRETIIPAELVVTFLAGLTEGEEWPKA